MFIKMNNMRKVFYLQVILYVISGSVIGQTVNRNAEEDVWNPGMGNRSKIQLIEEFQGKWSGSNTFNNSEIYNQHGLRVKSFKASTLQLDSILGEEFDTVTGQWFLNYKCLCTYDSEGNLSAESFNRLDQIADQWFEYLKYEYDVNENIILEIEYEWDETTDQRIYDRKHEYTYDAGGNTTSTIYCYWSVQNNRWMFSERSEYFYDTNGNLIEEIIYKGDETHSLWIYDNKLEHFYNNDGNDTLTYNYNWAVSPGEWQISYKIESTYNSAGKINLKIRSYWESNNEEWDYSRKAEYIYNAAWKLTKNTNYYWYGDHWIEDSRLVNTYDENGNLNFFAWYIWDRDAGYWIGEISADVIFDLNGNILLMTAYLWDEQISDWVYEWTGEFSYNSSNLLSYLIYYNWNDSKNEWIEDYERTYYYTELVNSIPSVPDDFEIKFYPNPANEFIMVDLNNCIGPASLDIYDNQGHKVISQRLSGRDIIAVEHLNNGLYICVITSNGRTLIGRILIK